MFTPASLIAAATRASAPGVLSMSMARSTAICLVCGQPTRETRPVSIRRLELLAISVLTVPLVIGAWLVGYLSAGDSRSTAAAGVFGFALFAISAVTRDVGGRLSAAGVSRRLLAVVVLTRSRVLAPLPALLRRGGASAAGSAPCRARPVAGWGKLLPDRRDPADRKGALRRSP